MWNAELFDTAYCNGVGSEKSTYGTLYMLSVIREKAVYKSYVRKKGGISMYRAVKSVTDP
jgi:hypothetical protein